MGQRFQKDLKVARSGSINLGKVTSIGSSAFNGTRITELNLPEELETIGYSAFSGSKIVELIIPDNVTTIGDNAFYQCNDLRTLSLGSSLETIGSGAFQYAHLTELSIPDSVKTIGAGAFSNVPLKKIIVGDGLSSASASSFEGIKFFNRDGSIQIDVNGSNMINTTFEGSNGILYSQNGEGIPDHGSEGISSTAGILSVIAIVISALALIVCTIPLLKRKMDS